MNWNRTWSGPETRSPGRRRAQNWLKAAGAVLLLGGLLSMSNPARTLGHLRQAHLGLVASAVLMLVLQVAVAATRWHTASKVFAPGARLGDFVRFNYIAQFFNQLLPAGVGGDAARVWLHHTRGATLRNALLSTSADRFLGLSSLFAVTACGLLAFRDRLGSTRLWEAGLVMCTVGVLGSMALLAVGWLPPAWWARWRVARLVADLSNGLRRLLMQPVAGAAVTLASVLVHILSVTAVWVLARSIGLAVEFPLLMVAVPVSLLAAAIPISIGGWGLREGTLVAILSAHGVNVDLALALSLLFGLSLFAVGVVGALGWIGLNTGPDVPRRENTLS